MQLYHFMQAAVYVICNLEVVRYSNSGPAIALHNMETSVGEYSSNCNLVKVRYWECPLIESPLYKTQVFKPKSENAPANNYQFEV